MVMCSVLYLYVTLAYYYLVQTIIYNGPESVLKCRSGNSDIYRISSMSKLNDFIVAEKRSEHKMTQDAGTYFYSYTAFVYISDNLTLTTGSYNYSHFKMEYQINYNQIGYAILRKRFIDNNTSIYEIHGPDYSTNVSHYLCEDPTMIGDSYYKRISNLPNGDVFKKVDKGEVIYKDGEFNATRKKFDCIQYCKNNQTCLYFQYNVENGSCIYYRRHRDRWERKEVVNSYEKSILYRKTLFEDY